MIERRLHTIHVWLGGEHEALRTLARDAGRELLLLSDQQLDEGIGGIEVLVCGIAPRIDWSRARKLVLLQMLASGTDSLWPATGLPDGVLVANARGVHLPEMRDHALALVLAFERDLFRFVEEQRAGVWKQVPVGSIAGKTLVILGLGTVGAAIAHAAKALGMRVVSARASEPYDLEALLSQADYVVVTLPLTPKTRGLIGVRALGAMKPSAVLVGMSRGAIIDEAALSKALHQNKLRGAALDVFEEEPLPAASPLRRAPRLVITPHVAGLTHDYIERLGRLMLDNVARVERGEPPLTLVNRERGY